jgi:hypothetical protein
LPQTNRQDRRGSGGAALGGGRRECDAVFAHRDEYPATPSGSRSAKRNKSDAFLRALTIPCVNGSLVQWIWNLIGYGTDTRKLAM